MPTAEIQAEDTVAAATEAADTEAPPGEVAGIDVPAADGQPVATDEQSVPEAEDTPDASAADAIVLSDAEQTEIEALPELPEPLPPPPPPPIQLILWNEKVPASAGCWVFWREAGFECRGKMEKGLFTATCKGYGGSAASAPMEIVLRRRFVSQGEAIAVVSSMLSFDPQQAENLGFEITGRVMLPFLPTSAASSDASDASDSSASSDSPVSSDSGALDEEQPAVRS